MDVLPENTRSLFETLKSMRLIRSFVLAGGSALALRIGHRVSQDLDFLLLRPTLNRKALDVLISELRNGHAVRKMVHAKDQADFEQAGLDLDDYQQDWFIDGSKLSFFVLNDPVDPEEIIPAPIAQDSGYIRIASLDSLFLLKSLTLAHRTTGRDLYDMYVLISKHGYTLDDMFRAVELHGQYADTVALRLTHAKKRLDDPGFQPCAESAPDFDALRAFFLAEINKREQCLAEQAAKRDN